MHIALNGWFYDRVSTGSGQYLRHLLADLPKVAPEFKFSLILPPHLRAPPDLPAGIHAVESGRRNRASKLSKVLFEQRAFPRLARAINADIAHVPYWGTRRCPAQRQAGNDDVSM